MPGAGPHLARRPQRARIVGLLVRARLVTSEEASFEVAHEALARAWPRLRSWLDEDVAGQRILRHLTAAADGWESLGRADTELYRGARLETALEWRDHTAPELTELERSFLDASEEHARSERRALEARAVRDAATKRRLRRLLVGSAVLLVVAIVAGLVAVRQTDRADAESELSNIRELAATAMAAVDVDPERSALLALAALDEAGSDGGAGASRHRAGAAQRDQRTARRAPPGRCRRHRRLERRRSAHPHDRAGDGRRRRSETSATGRTVRTFTGRRRAVRPTSSTARTAA